MDAEGKELSKSARKKCEKAYEQQKKSYEEYVKQKLEKPTNGEA